MRRDWGGWGLVLLVGAVAPALGDVDSWTAAQLGGAPVDVVVRDDGEVVVLSATAVSRETRARIFDAPHATRLFLSRAVVPTPRTRLSPDGRVFHDPRESVVAPVPLEFPSAETGVSLPASPSPSPSPSSGPRAAAQTCADGIHAEYRANSGRWTELGWMETWVLRDAAGPIATVDALERPLLSRNCGRAFVRTARGTIVVRRNGRSSTLVPGSFGVVAAAETRDVAVFASGRQRTVHIDRAVGACDVAVVHDAMGVAITPGGRQAWAWSVDGRISEIDVDRCRVARRLRIGSPAARPIIQAARVEDDGTATVVLRERGTPGRVHVVQRTAGAPVRCAVLPFGHEGRAAPGVRLAYARAGKALAFSLHGLAAIQFSASDRCDPIFLPVPDAAPSGTPSPSPSETCATTIGSPQAVHGWPLAPETSAHSVGTVLEYLHQGNVAMHEGADIMADPVLDSGDQPAANPSEVVAPVGGTVAEFADDTDEMQAILAVSGSDGHLYTFGHLQPTTVPPELHDVGACVGPGATVGGVARFESTCAFHHLHFRVEGTTGDGLSGAVDPLASMTPSLVTAGPRIATAAIVDWNHADWCPLDDGECMEDRGTLLVETWDSDGDFRIGVAGVTADISPADPAQAPPPSWTWSFSSVRGGNRLVGNNVLEQAFWTEPPYDTKTDYCNLKEFWIRAAELRRSDSKTPTSDGQTYFLPPGNYVARVVVRGFMGQTAERSVPFCVAPSPCSGP